jgi:hypothetical protein
MENCRQFSKYKIILWLLCFILAACSSNEKKKKVDTNPQAQNSYSGIVNNASDVDKNHKLVANNSEEYLNTYTANDPVEKQQHMTVAVIGAGAEYLAGNEEKAKGLAQKAYQNGDNGIIFPAEWNSQEWVKTKSLEEARKLGKMKDFIISQSNGGFATAAEANSAFLATAEYEKAATLYQKSFTKGLENEELRKNCYVRLAGSLFKTDRKEEAKQALLDGWLAHSDLEISSGDGQTKQYLQSLIDKFEDGEF